MAREYDQLFKINDRLILELKGGEIFNGLYADGGKDFIVLTEVSKHNKGHKLKGFHEFYRSEIATVHKLKLPPSRNSPPEGSVAIKNGLAILKISEQEYFRLKDMSRNYIYLENADKRFFDAIEVLNRCETIGVACLGAYHSRSSPIKLIVICSWMQVYVFDLAHKEKKGFYNELKEIFESESICKVIHKSAPFVDILDRLYGIYMQNTFDTQIVDLILQKTIKKTNPTLERDLSECLVHYLNFPKALLESALQVSVKEWNERPLSEKNKFHAAQLVTYLILLKQHLQTLLLKDVYDSIKNIQDHVYNNLDEFQFANYTAKKDVSKEIQDMLPDLKISDISK
ncbi:hypothetical protein ABEB36_011972 [Hypothenemus hampei]|uniref:3'-5' exonuclease domain-containing protein n=1 Tax=Hypothenemus hampei TaxID=57062 RepID=A0ABD1E9M2_HYPHA